jgi:hypothetical protein
MKKLIVIVLCCLSGACATVEPWERGRFTKKEMQFEPDCMLHSDDMFTLVKKRLPVVHQPPVADVVVTNFSSG